MTEGLLDSNPCLPVDDLPLAEDEGLLEGVDVVSRVVHGVVCLQEEVNIAEVESHVEQGQHQKVVQPLHPGHPHCSSHATLLASQWQKKFLVYSNYQAQSKLQQNYSKLE